jgi:AcrR family transcriptional regulator
VTEYGGAGDPKRTMELLWGIQERTRRGPKPRLSIGEVVRAAIALADAEGLDGLTIRRVADALGVSPMSVYTYVPGKAELLDLMFDTVCGEVPSSQQATGRWRARLEQVARENNALYHRHPWLLRIATVRPVLGPNITAKYDWELRAVEGIGLTDVEMDSVVTLVADFVHGAARGALESAHAEQHTGVTDQEWWEAHAPYLAQVFDPARFPLAARVGSAAGQAHQAAYDPEHAFEFGLQRILDGIESLLTSRAAATTRPAGSTGE